MTSSVEILAICSIGFCHCEEHVSVLLEYNATQTNKSSPARQTDGPMEYVVLLHYTLSQMESFKPES